MREVDRSALVPDESKSIDEGAVLPWGSLMWDLMKQVCGAMGVRTNVPFNQLTEQERDIVFAGPAIKKHILYKPKKGDDFAELDFTYYNAVYTVENALTKAKDEKGLKRVARFLKERPCSDCGGTRLSERARQPRIRDINLAQATAMSLDALVSWVGSVPESLEPHMRTMASAICESFLNTSRRLLELGLGYLSLDRAGATLSTGERQRVQLARAVRNRTTGVLYVLDEPSIGLHPANVDGLLGVMRDLVADGNSVVVVDHDTRVLAETDYLIEMGPGAGAKGGQVIAQGTVPQVIDTRESRIAPFLAQGGNVMTVCVTTLTPMKSSPQDEFIWKPTVCIPSAVIGRYSPWTADRRNRGIRFRQDDDGTGDVDARFAVADRQVAAADAGAAPRGGRCVQGASYRCHAYRREHTFHRRYILRRP